MRRSYIGYQYSVQPPTVPTGLAANAVSTSQINLTWNASTDAGGPGLKDYGVYRIGTGLLGYVAGTSFSDMGLTASTTYMYRVTARDLALLESAQSGAVSATTFASSGNLVHGQPFTITGSGFGTKSRALAPILRDVGAATTGTVDAQWAGHLPTGATTPSFNLQNQTVGFAPSGASIGAPHPYVPRIIAGCATEGSGSDNTKGSNIGMWLKFDRPSIGGDYVLYSSIYLRCDPNGTPNVGSPDDNNFKTYNLNQGYNGFYTGTQFAYLNYIDSTPAPNSLVNREMVINSQHDTTAGFANPDANGHSIFWGQSLWPWNGANGWIKQEVEIYGTTSTTLAGGGRIDMFENGSRASICGYRGYTDQFSAATTNRSWMIGGYNRNYGPAAVNNWRYFADIYFDIAWAAAPGGHVARVMVGNNPVYANCTIIEPSIPTSWADGSITFTFWKGGNAGGATGYIFVQPEVGAVIAAGSATVAGSP